MLKDHLKYYTKDESSSVMEEDAEKILNGIDYTIGIYLKQFYYKDKIEMEFNGRTLLLDKLKNEKLSLMYQKGFEIIKKKREESRILFLKICKNKLKTENFSYNDTIDRGLGIFFKAYDDFFLPQEAPCSVDYQLCIGDITCVGIEYIEKYLKTLDIENEFCRNFDIDEINEVLNGYDKESELLLINIFEIVFINSIGRIICEKNLDSLSITENDRVQIYDKLKKLTWDEFLEYIMQCCEKCIMMLNLEDKEIQEYMNKAAIKCARYIINCVNVNNLERVFVSFIDTSDYNDIQYIDKDKMSNSRFRKITEKIRNSLDVRKKIEIIHSNIKSLQDMIDMLEADCLFGDEFGIFFDSLSEIEIVLLFKHIKDFDLWDRCKKEWHGEFKNYILNLSEEKYVHIEEVAAKIRII